ncbi:MAG: SDR family NAD(P)-dependent oxidoreductase, partial [Notoacmeibacter sp.]
MKMQGNTILVTGGNSGIGEALAVAFHKAGNHVIIAGRNAATLAKVTAANKGMTSYVLDVADGKAIAEFAKTVAKNHPDLNVLVNNAGIGRVENALADTVSVAEAEETIAINVLGPIRLTAALLPHLRSKADSTII